MRIPGRCSACVATGTLALWFKKSTYGQPQAVQASDPRRVRGSYRIIIAFNVQRGKVLEFCSYGPLDELQPLAGKTARFIVEQCLFCLTSDAVQLSKLK